MNVFPISIPPLQRKKGGYLAGNRPTTFPGSIARKTGKRIEGFSDEAMESLTNYEWPGNVRQLKNVVEHLVVLADNTNLDLLCLLDRLQVKQPWDEKPIPESLKELNAAKKHLLKDVFGQIQKAFLIRALRESDGNITRAAEKVGMQRPNFCALLRSQHVSPVRSSLSCGISTHDSTRRGLIGSQSSRKGNPKMSAPEEVIFDSRRFVKSTLYR